ncbi:MAG: TAXI family TRAP transporter solute-binding subunit [Sulfitobacter sp.]
MTEGEITSLAFSQFVGTHAGVDDETVYQATKAFWGNIEEVQATAFFLKAVTLESAFTSVNVPLHPGAARYYDEIGVEIPAGLRP